MVYLGKFYNVYYSTAVGGVVYKCQVKVVDRLVGVCFWNPPTPLASLSVGPTLSQELLLFTEVSNSGCRLSDKVTVNPCEGPCVLSESLPGQSEGGWLWEAARCP